MCILRRDRTPEGPSPDGPEPARDIGVYPARRETGPPAMSNYLIALAFVAHHSPPLTYPLTYGIIGRH